MANNNKDICAHAFCIGGSAAFLVESTFQLMCAREAIHEFGIVDYHIVMATFQSDGSRNQQMLDAAVKWGFPMEQKDMATVDFEAFLTSSSLLDTSCKRYDRVFLGNNLCLNMLVMAADYARKGALIISMDDGNATIGELKKIYHTAKPLSGWKDLYHWHMNKKEYIHRRQAIISKLTEKGILYANSFFTVFDDISSKDFLIYHNSFHYLMSNLQIDKAEKVGVVVIGTPLESIAKMYYTDLKYIETIFQEKLQHIKQSFPGEPIVYIPHPRCLGQSDMDICNAEDVKYLPLTEPVENYVLTHSKNLKAIYGYGSTALIVLKKILPQAHIVNIEFCYGKKVKKEAIREAINQYYRESGMITEQIIMPSKNLNHTEIGFRQNIHNVLVALWNRYHIYYFGEWNNRYDFPENVDLPQKVSNHIERLLTSEKPCMIARFGNSELTCMLYYIRRHHPLSILRKYKPFWVPEFVRTQMIINAGFFPDSNDAFCRFSDLLYEAAKQVDLLGSWINREKVIESKFYYKRCPIEYIEPYWAEHPWTRCLKGKKILVVHPFSETIKAQYGKREHLFSNPGVLPEFQSLTVIKSVQSIGGENNGFKDWFEALKYMEQQIDSVDYDVALIGCGAYGMPLAAHCKKMGKKAVHLGGALQLLFGIKGKRWEEEGFGSDWHRDYKSLLNNPYWVRPNEDELPKAAKQVEDACYW